MKITAKLLSLTCLLASLTAGSASAAAINCTSGITFADLIATPCNLATAEVQGYRLFDAAASNVLVTVTAPDTLSFSSIGGGSLPTAGGVAGFAVYVRRIDPLEVSVGATSTITAVGGANVSCSATLTNGGSSSKSGSGSVTCGPNAAVAPTIYEATGYSPVGIQSISISVGTNYIPEPSTYALIGSGLLAVGYLRRAPGDKRAS